MLRSSRSSRILTSVYTFSSCGLVAQWIERLPPEQKVVGSNPIKPTFDFLAYCARDINFTWLHSFCRHSVISRLFLYTAAQFLPFFGAYPAFSLHVRKVLVGIWLGSDINCARLSRFGRAPHLCALRLAPRLQALLVAKHHIKHIDLYISIVN